MRPSFKYRFILSFLLIQVIFLALIVFFNFTALSKLSHSLINEKIQTSTRLFSEMVKVPMSAYDLGTIDNQVESFVGLKNIAAVEVYDRYGRLLSKGCSDPKLSIGNISGSSREIIIDGRIFQLQTAPVVLDNERLGNVKILFELTESLDTIGDNRNITFFIIFLEVIISTFVSYLIGHRLTLALNKLTASAEQISQDEKGDIPDLSGSGDELMILANTLRLMQERIEERNLKLHSAVQRFQELATQLQILLDSISEGAFGTDLEGKCTFVNQSFLEILGYEHAEEVLGKDIHLLIHHSYADGSAYPADQCRLRQIFKDQRSIHTDDEVFWSKEGKSIPVEYWLNPVFENGRNTGAIATFIDISARKEMHRQIILAKEAAEAATRAKSEFLATMSHEIRTPMNGVMGMLDLLEYSHLDAAQQHHVRVAQNSAKSLLGLINDILDFSKIEAGKMDIEAIECDVKNELKQIAETMALKAEEKGLALTVNVETVDQMIISDPGRLRQIVVNLLSNAIKFTQSGGIYLNASLEKKNENLGDLRIDITDTGIGIAEEKVHSLFEPFKQADGSTTREYGGTGLGLAIVKKLAELLGGNVCVKSVVGEGSTFSVCLTVNLAPSDHHAKNQRDTEELFSYQPDTPWLSAQRILVVDDDTTNQMVAEELLKMLGVESDIVSNGVEALHKLTNMPEFSVPYSLIFMDCEMPVMDGIEASKAIREGKAGEMNKDIPIIALTANAMDGDREKCIMAGMNDYLTKPIDIRELKKILHKWFR